MFVYHTSPKRKRGNWRTDPSLALRANVADGSIYLKKALVGEAFQPAFNTSPE